MTDETTKEFFSELKQDHDSLKEEEDRLLAHITKARPMKEAETIAYLNAPPQHGPGYQSTHSGREIVLQWVDEHGGAVLKQVKLHTDRANRLPLQEIISAWNIKNVRFTNSAIHMKVMLDGFGDLPVDKDATTVGIWADPQTPEEIEAEKAKAKRKLSGAPAPRKLSGAPKSPREVVVAALAARKLSNPPPVVNAGGSSPRKSPGGGSSPRNPPAGGTSPRNPPAASLSPQQTPWHLSDEERKKREEEEEKRVWAQIVGHAPPPDKSQ